VLLDAGVSTLVRSADEYGIPLILGGAESTLYELTGLYASMARAVLARDPDDATFFAPRVLARGEPGDEAGRSGRPTEAPGSGAPNRLAGEPVVPPLSPAALYLTLTALNEVERPEELAGWRHVSGTPAISWKTGTSYGLRDAWAIGVTSRYAVGVWAGNATGEGSPGLRGTASAGPLMFQLFELLDPAPGLVSPGRLRAVRVCADSGLVAGPDCARVEQELVPSRAHDLAVCPYCRTLHLDAERVYQVTSDVYPVSRMRHERWFVLPGAMAYYYRQAAADYVPPPPLHPLLADARSLSLEFPGEGASVYLPVEMDGGRGSVVARAYHAERGVPVYWHLDGHYLGETVRDHSWELSPPAGEHELALVDGTGHTVAVRFRVLNRDAD